MTTFRTLVNRSGITFNDPKDYVIYAEDLIAIHDAINAIEESLDDIVDLDLDTLKTDFTTLSNNFGVLAGQDFPALVDTVSGLSDAVASLQNPPYMGARVYKNATQSIGTSLTVLSFQVESYDASSFHDNSTNNSRLTVPYNALYSIKGLVNTTSNSIVRAQIRVNGSTVIASTAIGNAGSGTDNGAFISTDYYLNAGDYVELLGAFGSTWNASSGLSGCFFSISLIGY